MSTSGWDLIEVNRLRESIFQLFCHMVGPCPCLPVLCCLVAWLEWTQGIQKKMRTNLGKTRELTLKVCQTKQLAKKMMRADLLGPGEVFKVSSLFSWSSSALGWLLLLALESLGYTTRIFPWRSRFATAVTTGGVLEGALRLTGLRRVWQLIPVFMLWLWAQTWLV